MNLGAFSISLAVNDIQVSFDFYQKLGFAQMGGHIDQKWLIMKNGHAVIGLFEGMFEQNIITMNPGWDQNAQNADPFDDVRAIQAHLKSLGVQLTNETDPQASGPAHIVLHDPDGNQILIDQHR
jgi:catechol 2,3-dioxygenase-like lactoylglutathione lyase family enzyme